MNQPCRSISTTPYEKPKNTFLSRFKTPLNTTVPEVKSSKSTSTLHQKKKRGPVPSMSTNTVGRKKYEAVLGVKSEEIFAVPEKSISINGKIGNLFKKKKIPKSTEEPTQKKCLKPKNSSQDTANKLLNTPSARKSTGSYSIYSTFESIYGDNHDPTETKEMLETSNNDTIIHHVDFAQILNSKIQAGMIATNIIEEIDEDESTEDDDVLDDDFVDAIDISQEDILEREKAEARLSKRLSGGHFGSAGGLLLSIASERRTSKPPPEDVVQSMINWKRQSGQNFGQSLQDQSFSDFISKNENSIVPEKHQSQQIDRYPPPPQRALPPHPDINLFTNKDMVPSKLMDSDPKSCASRLWLEDESFVKREQIAEWLGQSKSLNMNTLKEYMTYFDFSKMRLDVAFRKVCSKLYFRAEAQQIDRILEAFAKRFWQCNPKSIFGSSDIVYAVVYSVLLLNTDLHVAQGNYARMTRQEFVRNTMSTVREQHAILLKSKPKSKNQIVMWESKIETHLKDMYISVKNNQILQPLHHQTDINLEQLNSNHDINPFASLSSANKRLSVIGSKRMNDIKRGFSTIMHKSGSIRESMPLMDDSILPRKSSSSTTHWPPYSTSPAESNTPRQSFTSNHSTGNGTIPRSIKGTMSTSTHLFEPFNDFSNQPPYTKEGIVMRKHLLDSKNQKAKHREWRECLLVVSQGEFKMYGLPNENYGESNSSRLNMLKSGGNSSNFSNLAENTSKSSHILEHSTSNPSLSLDGVSISSNSKINGYTQLIGTVDLNHTLSNALPPPGYNRSRPFVFALQESNGGVYLIQSTSIEQVNEWVSTCNYWAARQSKEPLQGGVGNIEYGWGDCLNDVILDLDAVESGKRITGKYIHDSESVNVSVWDPPAPTMIPSTLDEKEQYENLQKYVNQLNEEINEHREIKKKILVKFQHKNQNQTRALSNWESKSKYMLHEIIKYQNYCNALENSLAKQEKENK